jgi:hypothetical protein
MGKQERYKVNFPVTLTWEDKGRIRVINGRCFDLSPDGLAVETKDRLAQGTVMVVTSREFGRMGHATVRHSRFEKMVCVVGLRFLADFGLSDPARRKILSGLLGGGTAMGVAALRSFRS